jgi:hypothetical protein
MINWFNLIQAMLCILVGIGFLYYVYNDDKINKLI